MHARKIVELGYCTGTGIHAYVILDLVDLRRASWQNQILVCQSIEDILRRKPLRLEQVLVQVDHHLTLFSSIRPGNDGTGNCHQLRSYEVLAHIIQLLFRESLAAKAELQNRHARSAVINDQRWQGSRWQLTQKCL